MTMVTDRTRQRPVKKATYRRSCLVCSMVYNYVPAGKDKGHEHKRGLFCSWACKSKHIKDSKPGPHSKLYIGKCVTCESDIVARSRRLYCGKPCVFVPKSEPKPPMDRTCRLCSNQYLAENTGGMHKQYCSAECQKVVDDQARRVMKARRKAVLKGATVERVDPFKVFDRDGWKCKMCGIDTPKDKRGTWDNDAPELDHVVPLSKGGEHSYANTQCTCRKCNIRKSDNILPNISSCAQNLDMLHRGTSILPAPIAG